MVSTQVESGAVIKSAASHLSVVLYSDKIKAGKTLTITKRQKFCGNCNTLSNSNTNDLKKSKTIIDHTKT